jgi:hypothetical protein
MLRSPTLTLVLVVLAAVACASRRLRQPPEMSGFLDDYSVLHEGRADEADLVYRNPAAKWTAYDKVLLEPVVLWRSGRKSLDPVPEDDLLRLVSALQAATRRRIGEGFALVDAPGPGVMRIRLGITEARASDPILDVLTAKGDAASQDRSDGPLHPETRRFVDAGAIEGEIRDAQSGELLAQGVQRRRHGKSALPMGTWAEVERAFDAWADRVFGRIEAQTGRH